MTKSSTDQVARLLGLDPGTLSRYIKAGKVIAPPETMSGGMRMRLWSEREIERLRNILPKIANGRKTRWQRQREKEKGAPARAPHKKRESKNN